MERYGGVPPYAETRAYVAAILGRMGHAADEPYADGGAVLNARMAAAF